MQCPYQTKLTGTEIEYLLDTIIKKFKMNDVYVCDRLSIKQNCVSLLLDVHVLSPFSWS